MNKVTHHSSETYRSSLQLSRKRSDTSILNSRFSITNKKNPNSNHSICVLMLQTYLSDILKTLSSTNTISDSSYQKLFSMKKILNDCMSISKISLEFYCLVDSALNFISKLYSNPEISLIQDLIQLLLKIFSYISSYKYLADTISIPIRGNKNLPIHELLGELNIRINRITPRIINVTYI